MANKYPCFAVTNPHMPIMHPNSFEVIPWVNFTSNINSFFNSSFVHNKLLNVNYMFTTPRTAFLFAHEFAHKKYINLSAVAHCKLLSSRGSILFTMLNDKFDVQAASDEVNIEGDAFKIDALVSSRKNFDEQVWRLGLHYRSTLGSTQNLRLRYCGQTNNLSIGNKSMTISGNWKFSNLLIYDWT